MKLKKTLELVWVKAGLNLRSQASVNYLSYAWWVIEPLFHMVTYYVVFAVLLNKGGEDYLPFLLSGLVPWLWFAKVVNHCQGSILGGKELMNQVHINKYFFPLTCILQDSIKQTIMFLVLLVFLYVYGMTISWVWIYLLPVIFIQFIFTTGFSLIIALATPFARDFSFIIPTIIQFFMFCSGVFFSYKDISSEFHDIFFLNPMAIFLRSYREILIEGVSPSYDLLAYALLISIILCLISRFLYKKFEYTLPRLVLE